MVAIAALCYTLRLNQGLIAFKKKINVLRNIILELPFLQKDMKLSNK
jgi:hypothetical protein